MDPRELEEYPICNICHTQIDLQEGPYCEVCREVMNDEDADWDDPKNYWWVCEFDATTIYRQDIQKQIGRVLTNDEWDALVSSLSREIDDSTWNLIENAIEELKGGKR